MKTYSISDANKYYRQNNNLVRPTVRCKPTWTVELLDLAGWDVRKIVITEKDGVPGVPRGGYAQPEDNLSAYCDFKYGKDASEDWRFIYRAINERFFPDEKPLDEPRWNWDIREVLWGLMHKVPFAMSSSLTESGHVVGPTGFDTVHDGEILSWHEIKLDDIVRVYIDDPYGRKVNGVYNTALSGFNVPYTIDEFKKIWRGIGIQARRNL